MAVGDLTTLERVKTSFDVKTPDSDPLLSSLISAASAFLGNYCNRDFFSASRTETYSGSGGTVQVLKHYPISAVSSVTVSGVAIPASAGYSSTGYSFDEFSLYLQGYQFSLEQRNVVVTYTAGYSTIPADLEQACVDLVGLKFRERSRLGETSKSVGGATTSYSTEDMTDNMKSALAPFKRYIPV